MTQESIFAGFGGQGVLTAALIVAYAGMEEGKEVCWMPSYGPEMRGGTANAVCIVSDSKISSPIVASYDSVIALNQPSIDKFEEKVKPGGNLFYDVANCITKPTRTDINIYAIPASEEVIKLNFLKGLNILMLGAFIKATNTVAIESIEKALTKVLPERYHNKIPLNMEAFRAGMKYV
jgi:2-oxoglutarate ferredoxin oxidoreductase subunit gamma